MNGEKFYSINEFATIVGVPVSTLRFYQKNKLIQPSYKNEQNGYYYYTAKDIQKVEKLTLLRSMDVPIKMIEEILNASCRTSAEPASALPCAIWAEASASSSSLRSD